MRSDWEALRTGLVRSIQALQADREFEAMRRECPELNDFSSPEALIAHLCSKRGDLDDKDRILAALVTLVQLRQRAQLARTLLWLGMWPGLDAVFSRRLRRLGYPTDELASLLAEAFTETVERLDLRVVRRVAASLVRSTEREVMLLLQREQTEQRARSVVTELKRLPGDGSFDKMAAADRLEARLGWHPRAGTADDIAALHSWLESLLGEDADLLIAVVLLEQNQREAAEHLGLSHAAARKRFQRALRRLRQLSSTPVSHFAPQTRV